MWLRLRRVLMGAVMVGCSNPSSSPIVPTSSYVVPPARTPADAKLDLLIVVDDSPSMGDAQAELARSIPTLIDRVADSTVDPVTGRTTGAVSIHVAVISSSLGAFGTDACADDDKGHLLPRTAEECGISPTDLTWSATFGDHFSGDEGRNQLGEAVSCAVKSAGTSGCDYASTWEAAYHFLVDPKPYAKAAVNCSGDCGTNKIVVEGVDDTILDARKRFLRTDSLLAVLVVSDKNDASLKPAGLNWLPWAYAQGTMPRGWGDCAKVPDDFEPELPAEYETLHTTYHCKSCFEDPSDPACSVPWLTSSDTDDRTVRNFQQTQRFGYNFLWSRNRYLQAFTNPQAVASDGTIGTNPVFAGGFRTKDLVLVGAIVGVPPTLAKESPTEADWDRIVGPQSARDPHMLESIAARPGLPAYAGDRSVDPISGGERVISVGNGLQYACIGLEKKPTDSGSCLDGPLCDGTSQTHFGATPGLRHLRIVHDLGASGFAASICNESYEAPLTTFANKLRTAFGPQCLASGMPIRDGHADCELFEALPDDGGGKTCEQLGRGLCTPGAAPCRVDGSADPPVDVATAAGRLVVTVYATAADGTLRERDQATVEGANVIVTASDGKKHLVCEARQLIGDAECLHEKSPAPRPDGGWCFTTDPNVLSSQCPYGTVRFVGDASPAKGSTVTYACNVSG